MALVFGDSFDHYNWADVLKKWTSITNAASSLIRSDFALPPHGAGLLLAGNNPSILEKTLASSLTSLICGFWFRTGLTTTASIIWQAIEATTEHVSLRYDTTGKLTFTRNATVLATSVNALAIDTWYHVEVKVAIHDTTGTYEVRVNGSATGWIPAATGADTRNAATGVVTGVRLYNRGVNDAGTTAHRFQDFYLLDTTGSVAANFLGPCRFAVLRPTGPGNSAAWVGNYADNYVNVSDQFADGDATFNQSATPGAIDLFTMTDAPSGVIHAVQHVTMARQDAGPARTLRTKTRLSGTNYNGTTVPTAAGYTFLLEAATLNPATSAQWTAAELAAAEFGYELVS